MTQPTNKSKSPMNRGAKLFIASLSVAMTLSGWAWLTMAQPATAVDAGETDPTEQAPEMPPPQILGAVGDAGMPAVPTPSVPRIPSLASLPVRGLREVGDPLPEAANAPAPQEPGSPPRQRQDRPASGGGGSQPPKQAKEKPPAPPPAPPPKPRKTKPSK